MREQSHFLSLPPIKAKDKAEERTGYESESTRETAGWVQEGTCCKQVNTGSGRVRCGEAGVWHGIKEIYKHMHTQRRGDIKNAQTHENGEDALTHSSQVKKASICAH